MVKLFKGKQYRKEWLKGINNKSKTYKHKSSTMTDLLSDRRLIAMAEPMTS